MPIRAIAARILRVTLISLLGLILLTIAFVQIQQHLLRHRAARLLADFHSLEINRTTWPEAQQVIGRWHNWGYPTGSCSSTHCVFTIEVQDTLSMHLYTLPARATNWISDSGLPRSLERIGWREGEIKMRLLIDGGRLKTKEIGLLVEASSHGYPDPIGVEARAYPNLVRETSALSYASQMADHPDYFISRPGGCDTCMFAYVNFTPQISNDDLNNLTAFRLDCFTRLHPCNHPGDLLPPVASFHFYEVKETWPPTLSLCSAPVAPRARDSRAILVVNTLSQTFAKTTDDDAGPPTSERDTVQPVTLLKGGPFSNSPKTLTVAPSPGLGDDDQKPGPHPLAPGNRYILLLNDAPYKGLIVLDDCNVLPDSPLNRAEVMKGIAQDNALDLPSLSWW